MDNKNLLCSWSGGKDSCYALMKAAEAGHIPRVLLNVMNESGKLSRSHGIPAAILEAQAKAAGIPVKLIASSWADYENKFTGALKELAEQFQLKYAVFGDIDLQAHRDWEEKVCSSASLTALLPLWQQNRRLLVTEMLKAGIKTMIVSCNDTLGAGFLGRVIDEACIKDLDSIGVDVCGENGEFHSLVLDCPLFSNEIKVAVTNKQQHENYWFAGLQLA
jgi:uncharacterized protein (TIGR00290 family)